MITYKSSSMPSDNNGLFSGRCLLGNIDVGIDILVIDGLVSGFHDIEIGGLVRGYELHGGFAKEF